jgi:FkbM family methyltransferase
MKLLARMVNLVLGLVGLKLILKSDDAFRMTAALERLSTRIPEARTVIDIGASNGTWSVSAMRAFPSANFLAVEPLHERERSLQLISYRTTRFDYALCVAGAPNESSVSINVAEDLDGSTIDTGGNSGRQVPSKTIDQLVAEKRLTGPYILKFDTHGFEEKILEGAKETLDATAAIIMECYNFDITAKSLRFPEMCLLLEKMGFRPVDIADPMLRPVDNTLWQFDLFFMESNHSMFQNNAFSDRQIFHATEIKAKKFEEYSRKN